MESVPSDQQHMTIRQGYIGTKPEDYLIEQLVCDCIFKVGVVAKE